MPSGLHYVVTFAKKTLEHAGTPLQEAIGLERKQGDPGCPEHYPQWFCLCFKIA